MSHIPHRSERVFLSQDEYKLKVVRLESGELEIQANRAGLNSRLFGVDEKSMRVFLVVSNRHVSPLADHASMDKN